MYELAFKNIENTLWKDAECSSELDYIEQTSGAPFLKYLDEFKSNKETATQQQMVEVKNNESANALKEVKRLCKEFGFTAAMLKGALAEGRKKK